MYFLKISIGIEVEGVKILNEILGFGIEIKFRGTVVSELYSF